MTDLIMVSGRNALQTLGPPLDDLYAASCAPVTARRPWLQIWVEETPSFTPLVVAVGSPARLDAVATLATRRVGPALSIRDLGYGPSDYQTVPARSPEAAERLASGLVKTLERLRSPWVLNIGQLSEDDHTVPALTRHLEHVEVTPGVSAPAARIGQDRSLATYLSRNARQTVRNGEARLRREGRRFEVSVVRDVDRLPSTLDLVGRLKVRRDLDARGHSSLRDDRSATMWRRIICEHVARGEAELLIAFIDDAPAAYAVAFIDGGAYRIWDLRYEPELKRYSPGRLLGQRLFERVLADGSLTEVDWMNGTEPYKLSMSNTVVPRVNLRAWSSRSMRRLYGWTRRAAAGAQAAAQ